MRRNWLSYWDEAIRHPWRVRAFALASGVAVGVGVAWWNGELLLMSRVAVAVGVAAIFVLVCERALRHAAAQTPAQRRATSRAQLRQLPVVVGIYAAFAGGIYALAALTHALWAVLGAGAVFFGWRSVAWARRARRAGEL